MYDLGYPDCWVEGLPMFVSRDIADKLRQLAAGFPAVFLTGPRQSGKSTLLKHTFPDYDYVSLEETDYREFALNDPRGFLSRYKAPVILDEVQRTPELLSYLQTLIDTVNEPGMYLLSGSQNFLMMRSVSQSLAGRAGLATLLPFSLSELKAGGIFPDTMNAWLYRGTYPRSLTTDIQAEDFYQTYIPTYVERDVRQETGIHDLERFQGFLAACTQRIGGLVNYTDLGRDAGIDARTARSWLSILEESYLVFRLMPWHRNIGKRYTKTPKLYFHDSGLACALLGIRNERELLDHDLRGHIFENAVIAESYKMSFNAGRRPRSYFWRDADQRRNEIDLLIEHGQELRLFEVKAAQTARDKHARAMRLFSEGYGSERTKRTVIYDGPESIMLNGAEFINWRSLSKPILS
jgi:predicted AAA+ superfamily ATPase